MTDRKPIIAAILNMPDEAFGWIVVANETTRWFSNDDRTAIVKALTTMSDTMFKRFALCVPQSAMLHGGEAQIWPDGVGGFSGASRASITAIRSAADTYLKEVVTR